MLAPTRHSPLQSLVTFRNNQGETARGTLLKLERSTAVFEVYNPYSIVQLSEVLNPIILRRGERVIYQGRGVVKNLLNTGLMLIVSAKLLDPWTGLSSLLQDDDDEVLEREVDRFLIDWKRANQLRKGFSLAVTNLRSFLCELSRWLGQLELDLTIHSPPNRVEDDRILTRLCENVFPQLDDLFEAFEHEALALSSDEVDRHKDLAQRDLHPLLLSAPFVHRTYSKPLGYAGDYMMMNMIQRDPSEGNTIYARLINRLFLKASIPQSVRNRNDTLFSYLVNEAKLAAENSRRFRVLNIGCGPAIEVQRFVSEHRPCVSCDFELLDFNKETLEYAKQSIDNARAAHSTSDVSISYIHESIHNLLKSPQKMNQPEEQYDLVYCSGLFDYLSDRVCHRLVRYFYALIRPGGTVLVTNMHSSNPNRSIMDHLMEWYLIYRDEKSVAAMASGIQSPRVFTDVTGNNVCLELRKAGST